MAEQTHAGSPCFYVSLATIIRNRRLLGWTYRGSAYCQVIRPINAQKRLVFAQTYLRDSFADVIWSDESTIQLETHKRYCYRKKRKNHDLNLVPNIH